MPAPNCKQLAITRSAAQITRTLFKEGRFDCREGLLTYHKASCQQGNEGGNQFTTLLQEYCPKLHVLNLKKVNTCTSYLRWENKRNVLYRLLFLQDRQGNNREKTSSGVFLEFTLQGRLPRLICPSRQMTMKHRRAPLLSSPVSSAWKC